VQTAGGQIITLGKRLGDGGEAKVFEVLGQPTRAAKVYISPNQQRSRKLEAMVSRRPKDPTASLKHCSMAWPQDIVFDQGKTVGFLMQRIDFATSTPLFRLYNPYDRRKYLPNFTWRYLLRTARNLASVVDALHAESYIIGDINESNFLVSNSALVSVVDCDSMQVVDKNGIVHLCLVGKAEYTAPELQGLSFGTTPRTKESDLFGLATIIYLLLMEGVHPFSGVWKGSGEAPNIPRRIALGAFPYSGENRVTPPPFALPFTVLPEEIRHLFLRAFAMPGQTAPERPSASEWINALRRAERHLVECVSNEQHIYPRHLNRCPWCVRVSQNIPDPFPGSSVQAPLPPVSRPPVYTYLGANSSVAPPSASMPVHQAMTAVAAKEPIFSSSVIPMILTTLIAIFLLVAVHWSFDDLTRSSWSCHLVNGQFVDASLCSMAEQSSPGNVLIYRLLNKGAGAPWQIGPEGEVLLGSVTLLLPVLGATWVLKKKPGAYLSSVMPLTIAAFICVAFFVGANLGFEDLSKDYWPCHIQIDIEINPDICGVIKENEDWKVRIYQALNSKASGPGEIGDPGNLMIATIGIFPLLFTGAFATIKN
jgi:DNA-binding helix-hairpin-helix protein with protein kinase domain